MIQYIHYIHLYICTYIYLYICRYIYVHHKLWFFFISMNRNCRCLYLKTNVMFESTVLTRVTDAHTYAYFFYLQRWQIKLQLYLRGSYSTPQSVWHEILRFDEKGQSVKHWFVRILHARYINITTSNYLISINYEEPLFWFVLVLYVIPNTPYFEYFLYYPGFL